jgi:hypothetical protein
MILETAIRPALPHQLEIVAKENGLDAGSALALTSAFAPFFMQAEDWRAKVETVTDPVIARSSRLLLKNIRVEAKHKHRELKEDSMRLGKAIDGLYNVVEFVIAPLEKKLSDIETAAERAELAQREALCTARTKQLLAYGVSGQFYALADMPADQFARLLSDTKTAHDARIAEKLRAENDRLEKEKAEAQARDAKAKADAEEYERTRLENERLRQEATAREEANRVDREKLAAKAKAEALKVAEAAQKERARLQAIAETERKKAQAERDARAKIEADAQAERDRETARQNKEVEDAAKAAAAPDREKLHAFAALVRTIEIPEMSTKSGKVCSDKIKSMIESLAGYAERAALSL